MYGKIFEQILDSSIADDWQARFVFEDFIILADADGVVDMTAEAFSRRTNVPLDIVKRGIAKLEEPDSRSRTSDHEGRRLLRIDNHRDWGWKVVNHAKYRCMRTDAERREYMREYMREYRKPDESVNRIVNKTLQVLTSASVLSSPSSASEESSEGDARGGAFAAFWESWPRHSRKVNRAACLKAWQHQNLDAEAPVIMAGLEKWKTSADWAKEEGQFIPAPLVWLRQRRWEAADGCRKEFVCRK
jgi:hypothetical protein